MEHEKPLNLSASAKTELIQTRRPEMEHEKP